MATEPMLNPNPHLAKQDLENLESSPNTMGVSLEVWRQRIGHHHSRPPRQSKHETTFNADGISLGAGIGIRTYLAVVIISSLSFLMLSSQLCDIALCGDVELNPGPCATPPLSDDLLNSFKNGSCTAVNLDHAVKNKHILQLYSLRETLPTTPWSSTVEWMQLIKPGCTSGEIDWSHKFRLNWAKIHQKNRDLRKSIGRADGMKRLADWEEENYKLPEVRGFQPNKSTKTSPPLVFDIKVVEAENKKLLEKNKSMQTDNEELKLTVDDLRQRPSPHSQKVQKRREGRYQSTITGQKSTIGKLEKKTDKLSSRITEEKKTKRSLISDFKRSFKMIKTDEELKQQWTESYTASLEKEISELHQTAKKQKETVDSLLQANERLNIENAKLKTKSEKILFFNEDKNEFYPFVHKCVWNLLGKHVSYANVSSVIKIVLEMLNLTYDRLPSETTIRNMNNERTLVSQIKVAAIAEKENTTLGTDETPKNADIFMTYTITDDDGEAHLLGLRQMASKSAKHTLDNLKETLSDITDICHKSNAGNDIGHKVLCQIRNTMSDRAATEGLFNNMLKTYREECLPLFTKNWGNFSTPARDKLSEMYNFFCGLHLLTSMADSVAVSFKRFEEMFLEGKKVGAAAEAGINVFNTSSGIIRLVQNSCKALARGADEKSGVHRAWKVFKHKMGIMPTYFQPFRGNRFNVVFLFGGRAYFLARHIEDFLGNIHGTSNGLLKALFADVKVPLYLAGCKVLGIINKTLSAPLWRLTEKNGHIIDMCEVYTGLVKFLEQVTTEEKILADFAYGNVGYFDESLIEKDEVYEYLLSPGPFDEIALSLLQNTLLTLLQLFKRVTTDYLPDGKFYNIKDDIEFIQATASAPKHNKLPERIFGYLDFLIRKRPNSSAIANEAQVMYVFNKTAAFVKSKSDTELEDLVKTVRSEARKTQATAKKRSQEIMKYWENKQEEKSKALVESRLRMLAKKEQLTNEIAEIGLWQSDEQMTEYLNTQKTNKKKFEAVKKQIRFRREVLNQFMEEDKGFTFTVVVPNTTKRIDKPLSDIQSHLAKMINAAKSVAHSQSVQKTPDNEYLTIPLLVGKTVSHLWNTDDGSEWYTGNVISQVPGFPSWYNITYENDPKVYSLRLVDDYKDNSLKIIV